MVSRRLVNPPALGKPLGYAHGIRAGDLVFVAGQIGADPLPEGRHKVVAGGLVPQFEKALRNLLEVVAAEGGKPESVVEMTIYVTSMASYRKARAALGDAWNRTMGRHYPAATLVEVKGLFEHGAVVELRAVAAVD